MTTATVSPEQHAATESPFAHALRAIKVFAGAVVSVALLGQYTDGIPEQ
ncbi:hypothetical protein GCM10010218_30010 [Streptomyces mashuensis]|uniref:Uncharacterized protein n=1 Tax=Streptomyces mashuensis TaxID=33904 RepID=A0A919B4I8_9ACTN|nr:hypothetical protein [Streptomyces mashuensis]GHF46721.1 hypothetical protein GCM10010218_30010 [Streptomyces mashuensis]